MAAHRLHAMADQIGPVWINDMNGRPHWAKYWQNIPNVSVKSLYPQANRDKFNQLRTTLDPNNMFMNEFLTGLDLFS